MLKYEISDKSGKVIITGDTTKDLCYKQNIINVIVAERINNNGGRLTLNGDYISINLLNP